MPPGSFASRDSYAGKAVMIFASADGFALKQANATPPAEDVSIVLDTTANGARPCRGRRFEERRRRLLGLAQRIASASGGQAVMGYFMGDEPRSFHSGDGTFELPGVPPGRWTIRAEAPGYRAAEVSGIEVGPAETKEGIVLSLKRGGTLSGRVLDAARGSAVSNASVSWRVGGPVFVARRSRAAANTTDADGRFYFRRSAGGEDHGRGFAPGLHGSVGRGRAGAPEQCRYLARLGSVDFGVRRRLRRQDAGERRPCHPRHAGRVGPNGLGIGRRRRVGNVPLRAPAGRPLSSSSRRATPERPLAREFVLSDGQQMDGVLLSIAGGTLLRGTVSGLPAGSLGGLRVSASTSSYSDMTTTDADGHFTLPDVPAGVVRLNASTSFPQSRSAQTTVEVAEGAPEMPVRNHLRGGLEAVGSDHARREAAAGAHGPRRRPIRRREPGGRRRRRTTAATTTSRGSATAPTKFPSAPSPVRASPTERSSRSPVTRPATSSFQPPRCRASSPTPPRGCRSMAPRCRRRPARRPSPSRSNGRGPIPRAPIRSSTSIRAATASPPARPDTA